MIPDHHNTVICKCFECDCSSLPKIFLITLFLQFLSNIISRCTVYVVVLTSHLDRADLWGKNEIVIVMLYVSDILTEYIEGSTSCTWAEARSWRKWSSQIMSNYFLSPYIDILIGYNLTLLVYPFTFSLLAHTCIYMKSIVHPNVMDKTWHFSHTYSLSYINNLMEYIVGKVSSSASGISGSEKTGCAVIRSELLMGNLRYVCQILVSCRKKLVRIK